MAESTLPLHDPASCSEAEFMSALKCPSRMDWVLKGGGESFKTTKIVSGPASHQLANIYVRMGGCRFVFMGRKSMSHVEIMSKVSASVRGEIQ